MASPLLDLPTELLLAVLERVDQRTLLVSVPMVCRRLHAALSDVPIPVLDLGAVHTDGLIRAGHTLCRLRRVGTVRFAWRLFKTARIKTVWWLDGTPLGASTPDIDFAGRRVDPAVVSKIGKRRVCGAPFVTDTNAYHEYDLRTNTMWFHLGIDIPLGMCPPKRTGHRRPAPESAPGLLGWTPPPTLAQIRHLERKETRRRARRDKKCQRPSRNAQRVAQHVSQRAAQRAAQRAVQRRGPHRGR